jgi:cytochrome c
MDCLLMKTCFALRASRLAPALAFSAFFVCNQAQGAVGNPKAGADAFADNCGDCHTVVQGGGNKKGPNLFGIVGRHSSAIKDFDYSDANKALTWTWTPERLEIYLQAPRKMVPGTIMKFKGDPDPQERADIIAYLETLH